MLNTGFQCQEKEGQVKILKSYSIQNILNLKHFKREMPCSELDITLPTLQEVFQA